MNTVTDERLAEMIDLDEYDAEITAMARELQSLREYAVAQKRTIELQANELRSLRAGAT